MLLSLESLPHDRHEQRQISYYYRATLTITVILANAGTHSPASAESFVSKSPHSGKHLQTKRQRPPMPSFSRTREPIRPRTPSASLATVLTAASIFKRRDNTPSPSFSRTREPIRPRTPSASLAKVLTAVSIYKRRDNVPITVILANAGTHSSAYAECFVSKSPYSDKHPKYRESKVNSVVPSTYNARFSMGPRLREDDKK